ncbi:MFS transporter [Brevibacillus formosus]|uniref:Arabinose ABC transporter permease n=1 Tax=Brevibacillus formosus TaxID=54913 RepID=A0A837KF81_9BACL|nr:MFS transporter [Brevibacillus formosus]KLH96447.1 arabinose ABC transporter permease [Brevibacillus formosus]MED1958402.1 MFS transporter [Brevibacillus formosus]PSJ94503.1 MFS transporter [Brevibacillus formosus]GED60079.1 MFS transporter [Brevibacillus formosus]
MNQTAVQASVWQQRSYRWILFGQLISELGASLGTLANSWLIYQATGSQGAVGQMWLLYFLPSLAIQLVAGPYIDRFDKKRVMIFSQWMRAAAFCLSFAVITSGTESLWPLYFTALINGLVQPLYVPASQSLLPALVKREQLLQANAYLDSVLRIALITGPPLAGILVASIGGESVLALVAISYALSGFFLVLCPIASADTANKKQSWLVMFKAGLAIFWQKPLLLWLGLYSALVQFAVGVTLVLNLPFVAGELQGTSFHVGLFLAGYPLGYFFGSLLVPRFRSSFGQPLIMLGSLVLGGLSFVAIGFTHDIWLAITIELLAGLFAPFFQVHSTSLYQLHVPSELMGRVLSVRLLIVRATMPVGIWLGGQLSDQVGIRPLYISVGVVIVFAALAGILFRKFVTNRIFHI